MFFFQKSITDKNFKDIAQKKKDCQDLENLKIEMSVACSIFETQAPNFVRNHIF